MQKVLAEMCIGYSESEVAVGIIEADVSSRERERSYVFAVPCLFRDVDKLFHGAGGIRIRFDESNGEKEWRFCLLTAYRRRTDRRTDFPDH